MLAFGAFAWGLFGILDEELIPPEDRDRLVVDTARRMPGAGELFVLWDGDGLVVKRVEPVHEPPGEQGGERGDARLYAAINRRLAKHDWMEGSERAKAPRCGARVKRDATSVQVTARVHGNIFLRLLFFLK